MNKFLEKILSKVNNMITNENDFMELFIKSSKEFYSNNKNLTNLKEENFIEDMVKEFNIYCTNEGLTLEDFKIVYFCEDCKSYFLPFFDKKHLTKEDTLIGAVCGKCSKEYIPCIKCSSEIFYKKTELCVNC